MGAETMSKPAPSAEQIAEWLRPPSEAEVELALAQFAASVRDHYGDRLRGLYLFGSRARGDHRADSDVDVAVILENGDWISWKERWRLIALAYVPCLESGVIIQPWPFSHAQWDAQEGHPATPLIESARRDAIPLRAA